MNDENLRSDVLLESLSLVEKRQINFRFDLVCVVYYL